MQKFGKPTLAMLGGFSANLVYRVLKRLVDTIESLVKGDPSAVESAKHEALRAKVQESQTNLQLQVVTHLMDIKNTLDNSDTTDKAKAQLGQIIQEILPPK